MPDALIVMWVLLVPANSYQFGLETYEKRLSDWRIVAKYQDYIECEAARRMIVGLTHDRDRGTSDAFRAGFCVDETKLKNIGRSY